MPDRRHLRRKLIEGEVTVEPGTLGFYARFHLRDLEVKNYSPATVRDRAKTLRYFLTWANERAITKPEEVTVAVIERYQRFMYYSNGANGKRLSFTAQAARLMALRVFFRWLVRQRVIEMSPAAGRLAARGIPPAEIDPDDRASRIDHERVRHVDGARHPRSRDHRAALLFRA